MPLDAKIKAQTDELASASKAKDAMNSRVTDFELENAGLLSDKAQLERRITQLQEELEKSRSEKDAGDVAVLLQNTEIRELRKKVRRSDGRVGAATGVHGESRGRSRTSGRAQSPYY